MPFSAHRLFGNRLFFRLRIVDQHLLAARIRERLFQHGDFAAEAERTGWPSVAYAERQRAAQARCARLLRRVAYLAT